MEFSDDDYETILMEMFNTVQLEKNCLKNIFTLLDERETKREIFEHYVVHVQDGSETNLYEECGRLIKVIYDEKFWDTIQNLRMHNREAQHEFINFIKLMTDNYIGEFESNTPVKDKCIEVKKAVEKF